MTTNAAEIALNERFDWIALDFVNTAVETRTGRVDALADPDALLSWFDLAEPPGWSALQPSGLSDARTLHVEAVRLRVAIDALLACTADERDIDAPTREALGRALPWARTSPRLTADRRVPTVTPVYEPLHPAAALSPIAEDAIHLVGSIDPGRLRRCRADECLRWFIDTSKGGRRAWCSMSTCGNRAKAARYRARHEGDVDGR